MGQNRSGEDDENGYLEHRPTCEKTLRVAIGVSREVQTIRNKTKLADQSDRLISTINEATAKFSLTDFLWDFPRKSYSVTGIARSSKKKTRINEMVISIE